MRRIPQSYLDELMAKTPLVDVINERVPLKRTGNEYTACCPFHAENSPSFTVTPEKNFFHCFGCGAHGNALNFVMQYEALDFIPAVELLSQRAGLQVPRAEVNRPREASPHAPLLAACERARQVFIDQLKSPPAQSYLHARRLDPSVCEAFDVGFAGDEWATVKGELGRGAEAAGLAVGLLAKADSGHTYDRFRSRLMFPIRDVRGRVIGFGGRLLSNGSPKYVNSSESPIFHKGQELYGLFQVLRKHRQVPRLIAVEGFIDVLTMHAYGLDTAVATMGTAMTEAQIALMFKHTSNVYLCFDGDRAGRDAATKALQALMPAMAGDRQASFVFLPADHDPDSLLHAQGAEAFEQLLSDATPLSDFLFNELQDGLNLAQLDGRARLAERAFPLIESAPPGALRELMRRHLVQLTGLTERPH
ncbi:MULTISPECIES: DNA primase [Xanthomonas]|uniref:DNA primase n=1 Tax=Xanthomonas TaxID=338 RepID=UPI001C44222C|nr:MULTISPECIES: DNA primase [Xanthomonas]MBV6855895.1 DNA primase [Xanthomonas campestris pv. mirabilis]MBV6867876.1 DNA primase [Xanthomonas campestris pv. coriandri]MCE4330796.1 DNA primase [Xanthomonas campestris pv. coriandri]MEA9776937.1 DNA primase [Xanthomonas campestris pv. raphani]